MDAMDASVESDMLNKEDDMAKFVYVFRGGAWVQKGLSPAEMQAHLQKWGVWVRELAQAGRHLGGNPVQAEGKSIRGRDRVVTDGPYAESKDLVTGNLLVQADTLDAATDLARGCPIFEFDGSVEVRPVFEMEM